MSGGPVETLPSSSPEPFSRHQLHIHRSSPIMSSSRDSRPKLALPLNSRAFCEAPASLESRVRSISPDDLARRLSRSPKSGGSSSSLTTLLLDTRGLLCFTQSHIHGSVHIACSDRFNRKRVANCSSVLDLVSTWATGVGGAASCGGWRRKSKWREVVVYDEGTGDLGSLPSAASPPSPLSFVLAHLLQENRQPLYLKGGFKEFSRLHPHLTESSLSLMMSPQRKDPLSFGGPFSPLPTSPLTSSSSLESEPPTQVLPFLWVGNARDSGDSELLASLGIRYVLSLTTTSPPVTSLAPTNSSPPGGGVSSNKNNLRTKWIPVSDNLTENLAPHFEEACQFIEEARREGANILIHCQAGISRSPTIAIAYIMKHAELSTLEAYAVVQRCRRIISPNLNFMGQLVEFESKLKKSNSSTSSSSSSSSSCSSETMEDSL